MFWAEIWISEFLSENFHFLVIKFPVYLTRHVFVMSFWQQFPLGLPLTWTKCIGSGGTVWMCRLPEPLLFAITALFPLARFSQSFPDTHNINKLRCGCTAQYMPDFYHCVYCSTHNYSKQNLPTMIRNQQWGKPLTIWTDSCKDRSLWQGMIWPWLTSVWPPTLPS